MSEYPPLPKTLADAVRFAICEVDDFSAINIHLDDENEMVLRAMAYIEPIIAEAILAERNRCAKIAEEAGRDAISNYVMCGPAYIVRKMVAAIRGMEAV